MMAEHSTQESSRPGTQSLAPTRWLSGACDRNPPQPAGAPSATERPRQHKQSASGKRSGRQKERNAAVACTDWVGVGLSGFPEDLARVMTMLSAHSCRSLDAAAVSYTHCSDDAPCCTDGIQTALNRYLERDETEGDHRLGQHDCQRYPQKPA